MFSWRALLDCGLNVADELGVVEELEVGLENSGLVLANASSRPLSGRLDGFPGGLQCRLEAVALGVAVGPARAGQGALARRPAGTSVRCRSPTAVYSRCRRVSFHLALPALRSLLTVLGLSAVFAFDRRRQQDFEFVKCRFGVLSVGRNPDFFAMFDV